MADNFRGAIAPSPGFLIRTQCGLVAGGMVLLSGGLLFAQQSATSSYPTDVSASAGMTTSPTGNLSYRDAEMMQIRTAAQGAQGDAAAAAMARSADNSLEQQQLQRSIERAREEKAIKKAMANRMKWEHASAQNNKISANDMSSWKTNSGSVRVERNVPNAFIRSLIEEEEQAAARAAAEGQKEEGFSPIRATQRALSWRPFQNDGSEDSSGGGGGLGGVISNIHPPRLPFVGGGREPEPQTSAPPASTSSEPVFANRSQGAPSQSRATVTKPGMVPQISGAALVDGRSPVNRNVTPASSSQSRPQQSASNVSFASDLPGQTEEKPGLFSKLRSGSSDRPSSGGGGGLFSFGKKKSEPEMHTVDASLFPDTSVADVPRGGNLSGGYSESDVAEDMQEAPSSTGQFTLPGEEGDVRRSRSGGGFSIPKPSLSIPNIARSGGSSGGGGSVPTMTTINSAGTDYYTVANTAQFMVYGESQMQSEVKALPAGTVVRMTKAGEQWASIRLPDGTEGVIQNKDLRPASAGAGGGQFATSGN